MHHTRFAITLFAALAGACTTDEADPLTALSAPPGSVSTIPGVLTPVALPDGDGDGYDTGDDCNDGDAAIYPRTRERDNGLDDNCDGRVDEPMLSYGTMRPPETQSYAQLASFQLRITDANTIAYLNGAATVRYRFTFQRLSDSSHPDYITPIESMTVVPNVNWRILFLPPQPATHLLTIDPNHPNRGLLPRTVYRFKVALFDAASAPLGVQSDWFYVITGGTTTDPGGTLQWGRVDLVLQALDQLGDSNEGRIGAHGTIALDGSRFTGSSMAPLHQSYHPGDDLLWCDWFYRYVGVRVTDGLDGQIAANVVVDGGNLFWNATMNPNNVPNGFRDPLDDGCGTEIGDADGNGIPDEILYAGCQKLVAGTVTLDADNRFYSNIPTNVYYDAVKSRPEDQKPGNYQAMDHHAGMFLAFDPNGDGTFSGAGTVGTVWSIEGNVGNQVKIMHRTADNPAINGFGKLTVDMFSP